MKLVSFKFKSVLMAIVILFATPGIIYAQLSDLDLLFGKLKNVDAIGALALEQKILLEWSKSGPTSISFLLTRARMAIDVQDHEMALQHLNALTDHAPKFAEGWNLSAVTFYHLGKLGPALAALEHVLALEPRHFKALEGFLFILEDAGLFLEAFEVFQILEAIHPHAKILSTV